MSTTASSTTTTASPAKFQLKPSYPFFLANKAVYQNEDLIVYDKYHIGKVATKVAQADEKVIDLAIAKAVEAQEILRKMPSYERKAILEHVVKRVKERFDEFAYALCIEAGKPLKDAKGEVTRLIDTFQIAAEESTRSLAGEYGNLDISARAKGLNYITRRFPIGPLSLISPFNFPLNLAAHKIAPAIAAGCAWVMKPASRTPIGALLLGEILAETNLPEGAFSILPCTRAGAALFTTDPRFKLLSFTGSPEVGWDLKRQAGNKKVVLELGGNAACIIDRDQTEKDFPHIVERLLFGAFYQSGQSCISVQRVLVHESIYEPLKKLLAEKTATLKVGDPMDEETFIGPLIDTSEAVRIEKWVNEAVSQGAKVLVGGKRNGAFYDATIVEGAPSNSKVYAEEVFGPVFCIESFSEFSKAIRKVNDSKFGLQAGVFTRNIHKAFAAFEDLDVGGVVVNDVPSVRVDSQPYGGVKDSGLGREGIRYAMEDMTEIKVLLMRNIGNNEDELL